MAAKQTKPQALVQKRVAAKAVPPGKVFVKKAGAKKGSRMAAAKTGPKVTLADFALGVPKPRTGQAAVDLAVRAGVINKSGDLKPRFR
jgi:hypothetical protein